MGSRASLGNQFFYVLQESTEFGRDKHSDKFSKNNENQTVIYSYADRTAIADTSKQLASYIKEHYSDVRMIRDIKPEMIQKFINSKNNTSQMTIDKIWSHVGKIERMADKVYKIELSWKENIAKPESIRDKVRDVSFEPEDWGKVKNYLDHKDKLTLSDRGILIGRDFGLRVESVTNIYVKNFTIQDGEVAIYIQKDKGGRSRTLYSRDPEVIKHLKDAAQGKGPEDKLIPVKPDSINRQLTRIEEKLGIREDYKTAKTGMHSIRKMWAREHYVVYREQGLSKQDALDRVSEALGHGKNRNELMDVYIGKSVIDAIA